VISTIAACLLGAAGIAPQPAIAGTLWLHAGKNWNSDCSAFFSGNDPGVWTQNVCPSGSGMALSAVTGGVSGGARAYFQTNAPPGITINSAWIPNLWVYNVNNNEGWGGGDYWAGGGSAWTSGQTGHSTENVVPNINSSYYGFQLKCGWSVCNNPASIVVYGVQLQATENQGPGLVALGASNLWYQAGRYVRGSGWPLTYDASDPSGVCSMMAYIATNQLPAPPVTQIGSQWHQCPDQTLPLTIDTRSYVSSGGALPIRLTATNAAGVQSTASETAEVDNSPVNVGVTLTNDSDPNVWVNHAVTANANAMAGASGVAGMNCWSDGGAPAAYTPTGIQVDGTGTHTVSCDAWNRSYDVNGQVAHGGGSATFKIDETPPDLSFEARNPADPQQVVVDASDGQSGANGGTLEIRPAGGGNWQSLSTQFDGKHLIGHIDDAALAPGSYVLQASSCDQVGNCATNSETLSLPLRTPSTSAISFQSIVDPLRTTKRRERVLVGFHYVTVRRHGKRVKVKRGGRYKTITVIKQVERCRRSRVRVGKHRWRTRKVCRAPHLILASTDRVPFGKPDTVHGLLLTDQGVPISGQQLQILTAPDDSSRNFGPLTTVTTQIGGTWSATIPSGPSRLVEASYGGSKTVQPSTSTVADVIVPAAVKLSIRPRRIRWGGTLTIRGQVLGGYIPANPVVVSQLLRLRIGHGKAFTTIGIPLVDRNGNFQTTYTFNTGRGRAHFWFTVSTLTETNYPYSPASSRRITVRVGPG
jgi:hypothetical protein